MYFGANKTPIEVIREDAFGRRYFLEAFILVLMESDTESHGKNLISWKILIKGIIVQIIMILVLTNMVLSVQHR